jgi:hypothetical protein
VIWLPSAPDAGEKPETHSRNRGWAANFLAESPMFLPQYPSFHQRIAHRKGGGHVDGKFTSRIAFLSDILRSCAWSGSSSCRSWISHDGCFVHYLFELCRCNEMLQPYKYNQYLSRFFLWSRLIFSLERCCFQIKNGEITDLVSISKIITDLVSIFKIITDLPVVSKRINR